MASNISMNSTDSDVYFVEHLSSEPCPQRCNSPIIVNSMELSGIHTREMPTISSDTSPKLNIVTLVDDSNDPAFSCGFGAQQSIIPPSLDDLYLPPMTVVQQNSAQHADIFSPQSPERSEPSKISTPPMNMSTIDGWEAPCTTTVDNIFYSEEEPRWKHWKSPVDETFHSEGETRRIYLLASPTCHHHVSRWGGS